MKTTKLYVLLAVLILNFLVVSSFAQENIEENTNNTTTGSKYGNDSAACVTNLSLYKDFYNQWKATKFTNNELAADAYKSWNYCFLNCPAASVNMYGHGVDLLKNFKIKNEKDSIVKEKYIDTLVFVYQKRMEYFGNHKTYNVGYLKGRLAAEIYALRPWASKVYYPLFKESFDMQGNKSEAAILIKYFGGTLKYYQQGNDSIDIMLETYLEISDIIDFNTTAGQKDSADFAAVSQNIEKAVKQLFPCEKLDKILSPKFKANPNDIELSRKIVKLFEKSKCTSLELYYNALANVHSKVPSPETAFSMGKMSMDRKKWDKAKMYLQEAAESYPDSLSDKIANSYLMLAEVLRNMNSYSAARTAAYNALKYRPNEAQAYIIIGDLYTSSAKDCMYKGLPVAYWAAADKYTQAINMATDEKIKNAAQDRLNSVRRSYPIESDLFQRVLTNGASIMVECWINESTTIRAR